MYKGYSLYLADKLNSHVSAQHSLKRILLTRMWKPLCFIMSFLSASSTSISFVTFTEQRHSFSTLVFSLFRGFQHANRTLLGTVEPYYLDLFLLPSQRNSSVQIENPSDIKVLCLLSTTLSSLWNVPVGCFGGKMIKEGIWKILLRNDRLQKSRVRRFKKQLERLNNSLVASSQLSLFLVLL